MGLYDINTNFLEIISGTNNTVSRVYREAADNVDKANDKGLGYLKNFITSIENIANKKATKDPRISKTRGNIKALDCYDNIEFAINFIKKNLSNAPGFKDIITLHDKCVEFHPIYADGYDKHCRLVMLEYESVVDLLITGLAMTFSNNMEVVQNGDRIKIQKTNESTHGVYEKTIKEWATQLSKNTHKKYLEELNKAMDQVKPDTSLKESVLMESEVSNAVDAINIILNSIRKLGAMGVSAVKTVKNSIFGIVPLIRASMYLKYKKKADAINALDEQCVFIKRNIEQLQNIKTMDEEKKAEIIKKQEAVIEQYQKKAAKLRAQLMETEKEAATAIEKEDPELKKTNDDFVLEGVSITEIFQEDDELPSFNELFEEETDELFEEESYDNLTKIAVANGYKGDISIKNIKPYLKSLKSITIPESVTKIGENAFFNCAKLQSITIPNSITEIDKNTFNSCSSLKSITIPESVTKIGDMAFSGCGSLTFIDIPNSVTEIGDEVFNSCSSLKSITIPESVTKIGDMAFWGCRSLKDIKILGKPKISDVTFENCTNLSEESKKRIRELQPNAIFD